MTETTTRITQIGTVGIPVADHDKALEFYVGTLGFEVRLDGEFALASAGSRWRRLERRPPSRWRRRTPAHRQASTPASASRPRTPRPTTRTCWPAGRRGCGGSCGGGDGAPPMFTLRDPDGNTLYVVERA